MKSMCNLPINCDVKTFNEIWCGGLNDTCDSRCWLEIKSERKDEEEGKLECPICENRIKEDNRFFGTHIREAIGIFKEVFGKE